MRLEALFLCKTPLMTALSSSDVALLSTACARSPSPAAAASLTLLIEVLIDDL